MSVHAVRAFGALLVVAGLVGCSSLIGLDGDYRPPREAGGSSTTVGASSSTGGTTACTSNPDCAAPTSVCDTLKGACVECVDLEDCGFLNDSVCSAGTCVCESGLTRCGSDCADTSSSLEHCGS
ncbi:MAG: hypothetical protein FJ096_05300 [Deltaproteobacteria bacterium]|nr:hypothetical protein [Deltaproteobacteria bacterium]